MSVSAIGSQSSLMIQQLVNMRSQFDDLSRQLSTGQKSDTYSGLGTGSGVTVGLNAQLSAISGYDDSVNMVSTRISLMSNALSSMTDVTSTVQTAIDQANSASDGTSAGIAQQTAQSSLGQLLDLLNTQSGDGYLFSGSAVDKPSVETLDHILNGNGSQAGLTQLISERNQADLGTSGLGRLTITAPTSTSVSLAQDSSPFGLKLSSASSNLTNASVTGPSGSPASLSVDFTGGNPNNGDAITLRFNLPDGTTENRTLTATTASPPGPNQFTIGATTAATATNFQTALNTSVGVLAATSLTAASAVAASNDFFDADANNPPQRVNGPPFDTATGMVAGTAANTVIWYTGEAGSGSARDTATARVDPSLVVSYGARANELGIRTLVQNVATLAAVQISPGNSNANGLSAALNQRLTSNLNSTSGGQTVADIETQLATAQKSATDAQTRHQQTSATLSDYLQQITGVSNEEVGSELLTLQTRMQASMQTTSMLLQTSLVNYLPT
jgi:flagellin-like hook-associated protein FlgL